MNEQVQELIEALKVIKSYCHKNECFDCKLSNDFEDCRVVDDVPVVWDIAENADTKILL